MILSESAEMYLETILLLSKQSDEVHQINICEEMGFSKPSVSRAISLLKNDGYVSIDEFSHIFLTEKGREIAEKIYDRHTVLTEFLVKLGVDREVAIEDACRIEHVISDESFEAIKKVI